jgi:hypothetical protein
LFEFVGLERDWSEPSRGRYDIHYNNTQHNDTQHFSLLTINMKFIKYTTPPFTTILNLNMLNDVLLSALMLSEIKHNVIVLTVVAPASLINHGDHHIKTFPSNNEKSSKQN